MSASNILSFLKNSDFKRGSSRVNILHAIELVYRQKGPHVVDHVVKEFIRYGKEVEKITEMEFLAAAHELFYPNSEPLVYPVDAPDFILAPGGKVIWERPKSTPPSSPQPDAPEG